MLFFLSLKLHNPVNLITNPIFLNISIVFGGWNYLSFTIGLGTGIAATIALNVLSKRTIHKMKLFRSGDYVELTFFNAYWVYISLELGH